MGFFSVGKAVPDKLLKLDKKRSRIRIKGQYRSNKFAVFYEINKLSSTIRIYQASCVYNDIWKTNRCINRTFLIILKGYYGVGDHTVRSIPIGHRKIRFRKEGWVYVYNSTTNSYELRGTECRGRYQCKLDPVYYNIEIGGKNAKD